MVTDRISYTKTLLNRNLLFLITKLPLTFLADWMSIELLKVESFVALVVALVVYYCVAGRAKELRV